MYFERAILIVLTLCFAFTASAQTSALEPADTAETIEARELSLRARARFDAGDYAAALSEFTRAYELLANDPRRALLLNNIAVCHERMFRYDLALQYYERYLHEADSDPQDRAEVEAVIRGLRDLLGKVHITSNVAAEIWIDERAFGQAPGDVEIPAGTRVVKLQAKGRESAQRELTVVARSTQSVHFELEPLPEYHGIKPAYFWSGVGLTAVALVTGGALGIAALSAQHENERLAREGLILPEDEQHKKNLGLAADVCFGTAALFAVGSTVLFFLTDFRQLERAPAPRTLSLQPSIGRSTWQLSLVGTLR